MSDQPKAKQPPLDETAADELLFDDAELDRIFNQEASLVSREAEVMRVLQCFKLNPYEILGLDWMPGAGVTDQDIRQFRRIPSLLPPDESECADTVGVGRARLSQEITLDPPGQTQTPARDRSVRLAQKGPSGRGE